MDLIILGKGDAEILDITVTNPAVIGKIGDLSLNPRYIIIALYENGKINVPMPDKELKEGDKIKKIIDLFIK